MHPTFREAFWYWFKLGWISFGGPAGQIALMHRELVEEKKWIGDRQFIHALNFCMLLPGPEAQQLAIYLGWLLHRTWGGIIAGVFFVLPSAFILWGLSLIYVTYGATSWIEGVFYGIKPAIIAIVLSAAWRIGKKTLRNPWQWMLAMAALLSLSLLAAPFPLVVLGAGLIGWIFRKQFDNPSPHGEVEISISPNKESSGWFRSLRVLLTCLVLWWTPVFLVGSIFGKEGTPFQMGLFFSKAALVTFGGAYAVLPYVSQQAVNTFGWLQPGQMLDGLGLAETTPGPLIMVLQFVGFVGAWQHPGLLQPIWSATLGAALTTWVTFVPCFLFIFLGAPYVERMRKIPRLSAALTAITAAVVGVIVNLAIWFAWHVCMTKVNSVDAFAVCLAVAAWVALQRFKMNVVLVIFLAGTIGAINRLWF